MLSRVLTQKIRKRVARMGAVKYLWDDALPEAEREDEWERIVAKLIKSQQQISQQAERRRGGKGKAENGHEQAEVEGVARAIRDDFKMGDTFRQSVWNHGIMHVQMVLTREREDHVARADAMRRLIEEETALAVQEKAQRDVERRKRWEAKMLETHGEGWRELFPNLKENKSSDVGQGHTEKTTT